MESPVILHTPGLSQECYDRIVIQSIAGNVAALAEIPPEDLAYSMVGEDSTWLLLYDAWKSLETKLYEVSCYMQAKMFERELIEKGRIDPWR